MSLRFASRVVLRAAQADAKIGSEDPRRRRRRRRRLQAARRRRCPRPGARRQSPPPGSPVVQRLPRPPPPGPRRGPSRAEEKVRASRILIKHEGSRRKASWRDPEGVAISDTTRDDAADLARARSATRSSPGSASSRTSPPRTPTAIRPSAAATSVARPKVSRSQKEKANEEEVLVVGRIEVADHLRYVKFDVSRCAAGDGPAAAECAGSLVLTPHVIQRKEEGESSVKTAVKFGITDLLDEIGADGDKTIVVSLVPRCAGDVVTVGGVSVAYVK
ncbi:polyphenol oxidase II [Panicum miliaceum]|uniref:Polyphenol oxidase II n=1 Tax=Panicum miliaceum TaxID=4540 RepID=A0A3L6PU05_PANMI|nr:polyphenol oxidase II [Panicum miliaceum]